MQKAFIPCCDPRKMHAHGGVALNMLRFSAVIGGYGLFGVILDADIELTDDELYEMKMKRMNADTYRLKTGHLSE
jgi:hypothetical protein